MLLNKTLYDGQGYVKLLDVIPSSTPEGYSSRDAVIANTAKLSTQAEPCANNIEVYDFLEKLFRWKHFSPFEQAQLSFEIKVPMVVFWQLDRHRTFKYGSHLRRSGRYTEFNEEDIYIPTYVPDYPDSGPGLYPTKSSFKKDLKTLSKKLLWEYHEAIRKGVKKETARLLLPAFTLLYTERISVDLKNLMHFFALRTDKSAQREIRELAKVMFDLTSTLFPYTCKIFAKDFNPINYNFGES